MYTVKQVAAITGVPEGTLRMWERRYAVVRPERSEGGYRLYTEDDVTLLRQMAAFVAAGMPTSHAARRVGEAGQARRAAPEPAAADEDALVRAAVSLDPAQLDALLTDAFARDSFESVVRTWLLPSLGRLGTAWASGDLSVAQEHFVSAGVMRTLGRVFDAAGTPGGPRVLVGLAAGDRHEIALFAFATCLRRRGIDVIYLGADVPTESWLEIATERNARAVVLGVTVMSSLESEQAVLDLLAAQAPLVRRYVGGSRAHLIRDAHLLPQEIGKAADLLAVALLAGRT